MTSTDNLVQISMNRIHPWILTKNLNPNPLRAHFNHLQQHLVVSDVFLVSIRILSNFSTHISHMPPKPVIPRNPTPAPQNNTQKSPTPPPDIPEPSVFTTEPDEFSLYQVYTLYLSSNPDNVRNLEDCCDAPGLTTVPKPNAPRWWAGFGCSVLEITQNAHKHIFAPFLNITVFRLMNWFYSGSFSKSIAETSVSC